MSDAAQTVDEMVDQYQAEIDTETQDVEEAPEQVETEAEETESEVDEVEAEEETETDDKQEAEEAPEPTVEDQIAELKTTLEEQDRKIRRQTAANHQLQKKLEDERAALKKQAEPELKKPVMDEFDSMDDYEKAMDDYVEKRIGQAAEEKATQKVSQQQLDSELAEKTKVFKQKEYEFAQATPDYQDAAQVLNEYAALVQPNDPSMEAFAQSILASDNSPALIYHLGKNPEKIEDLMGKSPVMVARMMTGYEAELKQAVTPAKLKVKPKPPTPVKATGKGKKRLEDMSGEELRSSLGV